MSGKSLVQLMFVEFHRKCTERGISTSGSKSDLELRFGKVYERPVSIPEMSGFIPHSRRPPFRQKVRVG